MNYTLWNEECLEAMKRIPDGSVDMVMCDLPYGTTYAKWDSVIDLPSLWSAYRRICKPSAAIVLTASQPFTSSLVMSNPQNFRHEWIWDKENGANFANANHEPLKVHESVLVFSAKRTSYYPQKTQGKPNHGQGANPKRNKSALRIIEKRQPDDFTGLKHPRSIQCFPKHSSQSPFHPTQKPVALMEYLIKTYTHPGDMVLDNCMGSGTTGAACMNLGRRFIGIEKDVEHGYFQIAEKRIAEAFSKQEDWL